MRSLALGKLMSAAVAVAALFAMAGAAEAGYVQTNLVSDRPGLAAITDPVLLNPWGISFSPTSPIWVSNQLANPATPPPTNFTTLYAVTGGLNVTKVMPPGTNGDIIIPMTAAGPQGPTGQVNNANTSSFLVGNGGNGAFAHFIFANLNGTISAWDAGPTAYIQATTTGATYTGLAINQAQTLLYAANSAGTGSINVFNSSFAPVSVSGGFSDPNLPAGYVPFNVQDIAGKVYVTYAPSGRSSQQSATAGMGIVDIFDESGILLQRLITGSQLAAPWGIALAPSNWGPFSNDLLVGNFSYVDSAINAFDPTMGYAFVGSIPIDVGAGNTPGGLWALEFGMGGNNANPDTLFFTDGINGENNGLFAAITFSVPEPSTLALLAAGLGFVGFARFRARLSPRI